MDKKQSFMDFLINAIASYGSVILILNVFCLIFGDIAKEHSTIFALGKSGISVRTSAEFLVMSVLITALRFLFMTDRVVKKTSVTARTALMFACVFALAVAFVICCGWFPINNGTAWLMFIISLGVSGTVSTLMSARREKIENEMLNVALNRMKEDL